jgi:hypothetical protein
VASIERLEREPASRTDAIVALTGGAERIGDAIDLLAKGYGRRLLITGVNERTSRDQIARLNPGQRRLFDCCVDLDYRARNTIGNAIETRRWMADHRFRFADRGDIELPHAAHARRTRQGDSGGPQGALRRGERFDRSRRVVAQPPRRPSSSPPNT